MCMNVHVYERTRVYTRVNPSAGALFLCFCGQVLLTISRCFHYSGSNFAATVTALAPPGHCRMVYHGRNYKPPKGRTGQTQETKRCMRPDN